MVRLGDLNLKEYLNREVDMIFLLKSVGVGKQKNGGQFLSIVMVDRGIEAEAKLFNATGDIKDNLEVGKVYGATCSVNEYAKAKNGISCIINGTPTLLSDIPVESFQAWITDYNEYIVRLQELFNFISDTTYGSLAYDVLNSNWGDFSTFGAAKSNHHTELGGLIMHSVCTAELAKCIGEYYNSIYGGDFVNLPLLVSSALIHDIGKVKELSKTSAGMDYSVLSSLTTHVVEGVVELQKAAQRLDEEGTFELEEMKHCILSHHSKLEWGSPITPSCPEAWILSKADELDAEMNKFSREYKDLDEHTRKAVWGQGGLVSFYKPTRDNSNLEI